MGFSFVLNRGSGRRAHTLTGAEGQATEAAATMAADLEECVPRDFFWEIFLAQKNCPAGPPRPFSGLHWWHWPAVGTACGAHRIEFLLHPRLNLIAASPSPSDDVSLPATPKDTGMHQVLFPLFQKRRIALRLSTRQSEQGLLVDLPLTIKTDLGDEGPRKP